MLLILCSSTGNMDISTAKKSHGGEGAVFTTCWTSWTCGTEASVAEFQERNRPIERIRAAAATS